MKVPTYYNGTYNPTSYMSFVFGAECTVVSNADTEQLHYLLI